MLNIDLDSFKNLSNYDDLLVTDEKGMIIFYDVADLDILKELGQTPEEFLGKNITTFYKNLTEENSTVMKVLKSGEALCDVRQKMLTKIDSTIESVSSTYPIKENGKIKGAIEFSKHYYSKDSIQYLDKYARHKIYRKNNTVYTIEDIITVESKMIAVKNKVEKISKTNSTVLIYGKTGTGKELVAQAIHNLSDRYGKPFISLNCSAVPESLLESTLFGTKKGSFTGSEDMPGLFEQAQGGTLFLDEINSLAPHLQVKLLKAIEEKIIRRVGGQKNIHLDIRVISATNEDPDDLLEKGKLREDLFYRLSVVQIDLPNLAERKDDIKVLLENFINFYNNNMNTVINDVQPEVLDCFKEYKWPGNVRELKNAVETAYNNANAGQITIDDIPRRIRNYSGPQAGAPTDDKSHSLKDSVEEFEKKMIVRELQAAEGKLAETARRLGISKQSLKYKIDKYKLK
ncbi:arginine utilization regulatory protein [Scopulibacillus darangshiensis]|uniref:Arginine utilization regulatory protein n=1 Tax=Scopulibacillus darangshiensis TaxID=442528 RepID=A0A4R2NIG7_9BACL|nr:sigma 54-interacting transcriptional regulator [Scopulibacillus darangshiensis]TCP21078.1 arginine utilization regulatory protein [Scopulibacillus darangshiensis]